ncbi:MAG: cyclase family protein [Anaerolineales bacterium]|nr:cyclase family protein [Anaerolineales bacterium]
MRFIDISVSISPQLPVWPGDDTVVVEQVSTIAEGDESNVSRMACTVHTGTHLDAPRHFIEGGLTVDEIPIRRLIGRAYVIDLTEVDLISASVLENAGIPPRTRRILFKTRNSALWTAQKQFTADYVSVDSSAARWLVQKGVQLVGVDYLSVSAYEDPVPTHQILLGADILVLEGLDLSAVNQGRYTLYCLPLKILNADGAPVRAVLAGV